jgi:uncharacterized protein
MKIGGDYTFDGPQDLVWEMLLDPVVLAQVLPGAEKLDRTGENEYEGALRMKIGPIQGDFNGKVRLEDIDAPNGYTMQVDGRGAPGFVKATGHLKLSPDGERTRMVYDGDAQVGGKLAAVGQRLVESSARAIIAQSLEGLNTVVKAKVASRPGAGGGAASSPEPAYEKPSQTEFAASVAKQVARDLIPSGARKLIIAILVILVLLPIYRLAT